MSTHLPRRTVALALAASIALASSGASAQVREGVPYEALRAAMSGIGLELRDVDVPARPDMPVRLTLASSASAQSEPVAVLDVRVAASASEARAWVVEHASTVSTRPLVARAGVYADRIDRAAGVALAARENVSIVVRSIAPDLDALSILALASAVVDAAPVGAPDAQAWPAAVPDDLAVGASHAVQVPTELVAVRVSATGGAYARRTPNGWLVTRTSDAAIVVTIAGVDRLLRATH